MCEAADKVCHDEKTRLEETEGRMKHAAHTVKDKINEAVHHARGEGEEFRAEHKRHLHQAKEKMDETGSSASAHLHHAKEKMMDAKDSAYENTRHAGEKVKHGFDDAYDSTASGLKSAKDKVHHQASSAYDQASTKASEASDLMKAKLWHHTEKPVGFLHLYFPGFHAWLAIFTAIGAQLALGWLWYAILFKKPFMRALQEDRLNLGPVESSAWALKPGMGEKFSQAGHYVKDSAVANKLSAAAHQFSNSTAGQRLSQTGEFMKEKVTAGTASIQHAAATMKDKAEATAYQAKEKLTHAAHSAQESAAQTGEKIKESAMGQKIAQTAQDVRESDTAQKLSQTANDAREKFSGTTADANAGVTTGITQDYSAGPYSVMWGPFASLFTSIIRAFFMFHWMEVLMVHSLFGALAMALAFFIGSQFCSLHHYIWEGRPLKLLTIDHGCELALALTSAFIVYEMGVAK